MRMISKVGLGSVMFLVATVALAAESENQDKMQEDLDSYKSRIVSNCGMPDKLTIKWDGKLGANPRETPEGHYSSLSTLCQSALDATYNVCHNRVVKKAFTKVTSIVCARGTGAMSYAFKGSTLTFKVDTKFDKNSPAGQQSDLETKMKDDIDK
jgi:hypothetical protein